MRLSLNMKLASAVIAAIVALTALALFGGVAYGSAKVAAPKTVSVSIQGFAYTPKTLTVKVGTTVTWTNKDSTPHTVTTVDSLAANARLTGLFNANLVQGQRFSFTFRRAGRFFYECTTHKALASMHAVVIVKK
jgi:plastocyanin